ncbi:MAG TPA: GlxA family transcriptional regulator [Aromatoleum sp.]|uniref:GlxA family transcriptional regulator n=1 Tax=Aromatoleum sp. TaxID=2307007 RepID=UPI002B4974AC|nr:GlxA family transcriptional regulator [Aromatoleum sp.]HJV24085.1 GlxA family transcriptional regulator [Aromatoleum sp.]
MAKILPDESSRHWSGRGGDAPIRFGFLLVPDFTLIGFGGAVDPLRLANMVARRTLYQFVTLTMDGQPVRSSAGICVQPDMAASAATDLDGVFVVGPNPIPTTGNEPIIQWLRNLAAKGVPLGGVDTGSYFLACAGLLDGYRSTIHWEDMDALLDRFPRLVVSNKLYEVDRNRCSCSGGIAPVEMMIHLIGLGGGGRKTSSAVAELLIYELRGPDERQKTSLRDVSAASHPKLVEAIKLMECNIEEPLSMEELAEHMQFSGRQLERLFRDTLNCTPRQYYLQIRLERARQLLTRTNRPIADIVMACGFVSFAHFSHRYHAGFGISPSAERRRQTSEDKSAVKPI